MRIALAVALAAAAGTACSERKEAPAAPPPAAAAPKPEPLKIGFVYVGPVGDAGWTFAHDLGRKAIVEKYGDRIATAYVEKVPEGPDAERVIRDLVAQGNKLVFATSFGFGDSMEKVAKDHPEVKFEHATGFKTAPNLRNYEGRFYEDAYLFGGVTMLQLQLQAEGVEIPAQFMSMLPYVATVVVLVLISRNPLWIRLNMPASLGKPFFPGG